MNFKENRINSKTAHERAYWRIGEVEANRLGLSISDIVKNPLGVKQRVFLHNMKGKSGLFIEEIQADILGIPEDIIKRAVKYIEKRL